MGATATLVRPTAAVISGWAVLAIGAVRLALPQREVRQIDLAADLKVSAAGETATAPSLAHGPRLDPIGEGPEVGWLIREHAPAWPAYCLDENLAFERPVPADRRLCVFFGGGDGTHGILCNHVWSLAADSELVAQPLSGCMQGPRSPAQGIARFDNGVALVTSAAALAAYIADLKEADDGRSR